jgi:hypothetical protein
MPTHSYVRLDDIEDTKEIYRTTSTWERFKGFFTKRLSWLGASVLFFGAIIPAALKLASNLAIGIVRNTVGWGYYGDFNSEYFIQAGKNFLGCVACGLLGVASLFGIIRPGIWNKLLGFAVVPAKYFFNKRINEKNDFVQDEKNGDIYWEKANVNKKFKDESEAQKYQYRNYVNKLEAENSLMHKVNEVCPEEIVYRRRNVADNSRKAIVAPARIFRNVKTDSETIDTVEFPLHHSANPLLNEQAPYRIVFNANAIPYQLISSRYELWSSEMNRVKCNVITFNYPGVTIYKNKNVRDKDADEELESIDEVVNAGIAQIYALRRMKQWTWEQIAQRVHLYGHSLGGAVAVEVRAHFIEHHQVYLKTFADRTFSSLSSVGAAHINSLTGVPMEYASLVASTVLSGATNWNLDAVGSLKRWGVERFNYINLVHESQPVLTFWQRVKNFFGLGEGMDSADDHIPDSCSLMRGIEVADVNKTSTSRVLGGLAERDDHGVVYVGASSNAHSDRLATLASESLEGGTALDMYARWVNKDVKSEGVVKPVEVKAVPVQGEGDDLAYRKVLKRY